MIRKSLLILFAAALPTSAGAQAVELLDCIRDRFTTSNVEVEVVEGAIDVTFDVTNNLAYPVGGAHVMISATYPGRPTPLARWGSQSLLTIPGSLLPGESMTAETYMHIEPRVQAMIDDPGELSALIEVESIANGDLVSVRDGLWVSSWTEGPSGDGCS
ncbi:MAG: hypothetical protein COW55_07470 [Rhodobacteraceae bacterium CG17_big_fil_post_rev_8_21_14_2_50_65_11]|nr:MAG: hypothetical protein COW55_07470 [Rhodobacteraceae bacterium CG17_big_fil_post_rev_8_21_14_2_50_65_11]